MVEELKLAIKIDDASIEQSLLKQFANAQKMADKVVLDFRNVNFDDKQIEAKFKEMQKKAGQNPIDLTISDNALDMLGQIDKRLTEIFSIGKGKSFIDSSSITADIRKIENKINELNKKINTSFDTKNKTEAYNQLKKYADAFKDYYNNEEAMASESGTKAAYAYYKAYEEALKKEVAQSKLEKVTVDFDINDKFFDKNRIVSDRIKEYANYKKYGNDNDLLEEISSLKNKLFDFNSAYSQVKEKLGQAAITPEIIKSVERYVELLDKARFLEQLNDPDDNDTIKSHRAMAQVSLDDALFNAQEQSNKYTESLRQQEEQITSTVEAEQKLAEVQKETTSNSVTSDNSQIEELKSDIQEVKTELGDVKDRISSIESNGFENVREDVEKTKESVKELNGELTEMKSNISSTLQESNISSEKKDAFPNADAKPETEGMKQVEEATHDAVQAKKDFATANEGVQSSIDGSENPLKLEAELMGQIAKSAREAADAKKEFVEANKQVKNSADGSNSENKKKDKYAKRRKISEEDFLNFSPSRVNEKLSNSGYTILGETVNTELVDGLVKVSAKIKDVDGVWKSFSAKVDADGNIFEQRFKTVTNGVDKLETALKNFGRETSLALTYQETLDKAQKIKNSLNLGDEYSIKVDSSEFVTITKKLTDVENTGASVTQTFKSAQDAIDNFGKSASNSAERTSVALKSVKSNIKEVTDESEKLANAQKEQNVNANLNKYDKQLDSYNGKVDKYQATITRFNDGGWTSDEYLDNVQAVKDAVKKYEDLLNNIRAKGGITSEEDIQNLKEYESEIKNTIATVTNMSAAEKGYNFVSGQKELDKIHKLLNENSKMSSEAKAKIKAYYTEIESGNPSMSLDRIHGEIMKIYNAEVEAGRAGRSFFDTLKNSGFHQLAAQMSGMFGFYDVINLIKQAASAVTELNTQITELAKVSEDSVSQIYADFDSYANIAKEMGSTISDTIAATTAWSKNGYNIPDSKELAEVSLLYKNVGDGINIDEANESLVSTLKGFKLEADQAEHIVDVFNEVSNREPISSSGIGEALQRSAASFNAANTSLEKSVALVTATNSVLQDPEKVGNMWKTVSARIRGAKTELEEAGEDTDGMVESTSKLQALIKGMTGFDIMESDGKTFKDIYDIIIGIGEKWQDLNDVDRASLLEKLAGKNQSNALAAAISQVDVLKKAYGEATNAEGSAREENSKYQQSVQYSIDQTKAKLEELANDTLNSNFLKGAIDAGGKLIEVLDGIVKSGNAIPTLLATIGAALSFKNVGIDTLVAY